MGEVGGALAAGMVGVGGWGGRGGEEGVGEDVAQGGTAEGVEDEDRADQVGRICRQRTKISALASDKSCGLGCN